MPKEKFLLVSLQEDQAKKLAQVISNETCRQILDYLAEKDATESQIAKDLNIPLSTVHYNIQQLVNGNLVVSDEYHYSQKGKEVAHYKLANKYIIIAPKSSYGLKEKLRSILPVAVLGIGVAFLLQWFQRSSVSVAQPMMESVVDDSGLAQKAAAIGVARVSEPAVAQPMIASWFIAGVIFSLILYLLIDFFLSRRK